MQIQGDRKRVWSKPVGGDEQALLGKLGSQLRAGVEEVEQTGVELGELKFVPTTYNHTHRKQSKFCPN